MSNRPVPSKLTLLSKLDACKHGDKVRFLGWYVLSEQFPRLSAFTKKRDISNK